MRDWTNLQRGEHLALFFAVEQAVVVLHRDEGREVVRDGVVWFLGQRRDLGTLCCLRLTLHSVD